MTDQPNISSILAALTAQRPVQPPTQSGPTYPPQPGGAGNPTFPQFPQGNLYSAPPPVSSHSAYALPQSASPGGFDLSAIRPSNSGTVSIADAIAKARNIAAEKGITNDRVRDDPLRASNRDRPYRRSHSRSPPPARREDYRDNYNPYRDERRDGRDRDYRRDRSYSPDRRGKFPSPPRRAYTRDRSPLGNSDNVETIQIEASLVGLVIGRGGESMRRIEQESGARVQFITGPNDSAGANRDCKITGDLRQRDRAKFEIDRICKENRGVPGVIVKQPAGQPSSNQPVLRDGEDSMQIMVPDRTVGLIIGRGGETIRDLQEKSGCHINIVGENKSINGKRPVNLIGTVQAAANARALIAEIVDSDNKNHANQNGSARDAGYDTHSSFNNDQRNDKINDTIRVPAEAIGMIIGKGGETIREMQNQTGAKINVSSDNSQRDREIGLVGTRESITRAKRAIDEKVDAALAKRGGNQDPNRREYGSSGRGDYNSSSNPNHTPLPPQSAAPPQASGQGAANVAPAVDPYAQYGGYQNYVAMWYAAMAQQQQQKGQDGGQTNGQSTEPGGAL